MLAATGLAVAGTAAAVAKAGNWRKDWSLTTALPLSVVDAPVSDTSLYTDVDNCESYREPGMPS